MMAARYMLADSEFQTALLVIRRSEAHTLIDQWYDESARPGGRKPQVEYTMLAYLVAALSLIRLQRPPTIANVLRMIADFSDSQLHAVEMPIVDRDELRSPAEYTRFHGWVTRRLAVLDPGVDLSARRERNGALRAAVAARTPEQVEAAGLARLRIRIVTNRLVTGSIDDLDPPECQGDLLVDESIVDLAGPGNGLGSRDELLRGAAYCGGYYQRDRQSGTVKDGPVRIVSKAGFGVGVTAVTRVGPLDKLHSVPPVVVGIDIHRPTSGSVDGLEQALEYAGQNGVACHRGNRKRWPTLTCDMGYNVKGGFSRLLIERKLTPVARIPRHWSTVVASADAAETSGVLPGPVMASGSFYCPAAAEMVQNLSTRSLREIRETGSWREHDAALRKTSPFLMGVLSRPYIGSPIRGRPRKDADKPAEAVKVDLQCPATQFRVRCPLKPESMTQAPIDAPTARPTWTADERRCCANSSLTVTLTERQVSRFGWGTVGMSWEHLIAYEAGRAMTEQRFSLLKSPHITGISELRWGPRREPTIKLNLALAVAALNVASQRSFAAREQPPRESVPIRWRQLADSLGCEPARVPPRS